MLLIVLASKPHSFLIISKSLLKVDGCMVGPMALGCIAVSKSEQTCCLFPVLLIMLWINTTTL